MQLFSGIRKTNQQAVCMKKDIGVYHMKNRKILVTCILVFILFVSGCASNIVYEVDKDMYASVKRMNYNVVIDVFEDKRPEEEHSGIWMDKEGKEQKVFDYTADKNFNNNVAKQITEMLATHIKEANLFDKVELRDIDKQKDIETLNKEGRDIVIVGDLEHFYGFQNKSSSILGVLLGPISVAIEMANKKNVGGYVSFNIKVLDAKRNKVVWQGTIEDKFEEKDAFFKGPVAYALRSLKQANNRFIEVLEKTMAQLSQP